MTAVSAVTGWERIEGQDDAVARLQRAAARPTHAYLLVGPPGSGVEVAARCFAAQVIAPDDERAFDLALRGVHPDVVEVDPAATQIRVEDAQTVLDEAYRSPVEGAHVALGLQVLVTDANGAFDFDLQRGDGESVVAVKAGSACGTTAEKMRPGRVAPMAESASRGPLSVSSIASAKKRPAKPIVSTMMASTPAAGPRPTVMMKMIAQTRSGTVRNTATSARAKPRSAALGDRPSAARIARGKLSTMPSTVPVIAIWNVSSSDRPTCGRRPRSCAAAA